MRKDAVLGTYAALFVVVACSPRTPRTVARDTAAPHVVRIVTPAPHATDRDLPISWLFLPEDPVPTGSAPNVIVGVELPCGYTPAFGNVSSAESSPLRVLFHAVRDDSAAPSDAACTSRATVQYVSLQRLRTQTFDVTDATPHGDGDPPVPHVTLHVVPDNESTPALQLRRIRTCTPGNDATCTAGGVCAVADASPRHVPICVPPLDVYLAARTHCATGDIDVALTHPSPYPTRASPPDATVRACLPSCNATGACNAEFECVEVSGHGVCLPRS